jgi:hypothetical protein
MRSIKTMALHPSADAQPIILDTVWKTLKSMLTNK